MGVTTTKTNKPFNPRGNDQSPLAYNRAALYSGKALDFDGVNDQVILDGFTLSGTTATISFYYNTDTTKALAYVFDNSQRWVIGQSDVVNKFGFYDGSTWRYSTQTLTLGEWYHITAVIDGGNVEFLWNGESIGDTFTGVNSISWASITNFRLGWSHVGGGFGQVEGQIANTKIFNTALTAAQIADLYNNPEKIVPTGVDNTALKLWLPMMEGAGTTAYDGSGNGNHGTISGATYVNGVGAPVAQTSVIDWNKGVNLLTYSEDFTQWTLEGSASLTSNATTAPSGESNASKLIAGASSARQSTKLNTTKSGDIFYSTYAKKGEYNVIQLTDALNGTLYANFDLENGVIGNYSFCSPSIISIGNDWYRCSIYYNSGSSINSVRVSIAQSPTEGRLVTFAGNGSDGIYIWGASLEDATALGPYVSTIGTAQPTPVLLPAGLTTGRDITGVNLFENVRKQGALNLDGNSWAEVHDNASLDFSSGMTLEAWVKLEDISQAILGKWNFSANKKEYLLYYNAGANLLQTFFGNGSSVQLTSTSYTGDGSWIHFVGTADGSTITPYLNGVAGTTTAQTIPLGASDIPVRIGVDDVNASYAPNQLAQPRIYNRALTAEEVQRNYNAGKNIYS